TDRPLAVVLRINGVNTRNEQHDEPETASKWLLQPGKTTLVKGFYHGEKLKKPFENLLDAGTPDRTGIVEIAVFEKGEKREEEMLYNPRALPPTQEKQARSSYLGLRSALLKSSKLKTTTVVLKGKGEGDLTVKRELIVPDE